VDSHHAYVTNIIYGNDGGSALPLISSHTVSYLFFVKVDADKPICFFKAPLKNLELISIFADSPVFISRVPKNCYFLNPLFVFYNPQRQKGCVLNFFFQFKQSILEPHRIRTVFVLLRKEERLHLIPSS
jgi:hypothetical protein